MKKRTKARDYAVQLMYASYIKEADSKTVSADFWYGNPEEEQEVREFADILFQSAFKNKDKDDEIISSFLAKNWSMERIGVLEKSILRVAISELFEGDAPVYAIMNDYVTLAKKYGDEKSAAFINGMLESIRVKFEIERGNAKTKLDNKN